MVRWEQFRIIGTYRVSPLNTKPRHYHLRTGYKIVRSETLKEFEVKPTNFVAYKFVTIDNAKKTIQCI